MDDFELLIKVVIVGESAVGKTNLLLRYIEDRFDENLKATIGFDIESKIMDIDDKAIKIQFYDTAGQERFRALTPSNFRNADIVILVYDISKRVSFDKLDEWIVLVKAHAQKDVALLIIGNKSDLKTERQISFEEGERFAKENNAYFYETSAKVNDNHCVQKAFDFVVQKTGQELMKREQSKIEEEKVITRSSTIKLKPSPLIPQSSGCCF